MTDRKPGRSLEGENRLGIATKTSNRNLGWKVATTLFVGLCSSLLMSGCGSKGNNKAQEDVASKPTPKDSSTPLKTMQFFEDSLPGNPLILSTNANLAFQKMAENLLGTANITVVEQKSYDYTVTQNSSTGSPSLNRQEGRSAPNSPATFKGQGMSNPSLGRLSFNIYETSSLPARTFIYQPQITLSGIILTSTDQVALFKAVNPSPLATDFIKVNYSQKNPTMQRFKMSQFRPFQIFGWAPQSLGPAQRSNWINVISQTLTTVFQYPKK